MPIVQPPAKILVSGANGFLAVWLIQTLLEKGYAVRGTVRSLDKGKYLHKLFGKYGDKFELVAVENIGKVGHSVP
jgi:nucleoside-diphosphate-sugar epimerase